MPPLMFNSLNKIDMTTIIKSKSTDAGTFINTIAFNRIVKDDELGGSFIDKDWFYFESAEEMPEGKELPKFNPDNWNIRESQYTTVDEETGEETVRTSKWLDGKKA